MVEWGKMRTFVADQIPQDQIQAALAMADDEPVASDSVELTEGNLPF